MLIMCSNYNTARWTDRLIRVTTSRLIMHNCFKLLQMTV